MTLKEWSDELGVSRRTILRRIQSGLPPEEVFSTDRRVGDQYGKYLSSYFRKLEKEVDEREYGKDNDIQF